MIFYIATPLTILVFLLSKKLQQLKPWPILNPVLVSIAFLISLHLIFNLDFSEYEKGTYWLSALLEPAVVALALPLYLQLHLLKDSLFEIVLLCLFSVVIAFISAFYLIPFFGADLQISASVAAQSVTTPIAMEISSSILGIPALTAAMVICAGIIGSSIGLGYLKFIKVTDPKAQGLAMGSAAHALGTAKVLEVDPMSGAFSSVALILCAIFSAILMPLFYSLLF